MPDTDERSARAERSARLLDRIRGGEARCAVVGLGFIGGSWLHSLRAAGLTTAGCDRDPARVSALRAAGETAVSSDAAAAVADAEVVVVAVRLGLADGGPDLEPLRSAASVLAKGPAHPRLVLLTSTVPVGTTRLLAEEWLEDVYAHTFVAHVPERLAEGHDWRDLRAIPHLVGGVDPVATELATALLAGVCETVQPVSAPEVSELSKLLENAFRTTGIALVGEVTRIAHAYGVAASEVCEAAATKPFGYYPFFPGAGVGGHCLPNDLALLRAGARAAKLETPLLDGVAAALPGLPEGVVGRLEALLRTRERDLRGARVVLVGVGFKPGTSDPTHSPAEDVARLLRARGAQLHYLDSRNPGWCVDGRAVERAVATQVRDGDFDAVLLLSGDPELETDDLAGAGCLVLDAGGRPQAGRRAGQRL